MTREVILEKLMGIFDEIFHIPPKNISQDYFDKQLTGSEFGFGNTEMVYLFLEVSKRFGVTLTYDDVRDYKFNTINGIVDTLVAALK